MDEPKAHAGEGGSAVLDSDLRQALDRIVADNLPLAAGVIGTLLGFFALVDPLIYPEPWRWQIAFVDALAALIVLAMFVVFWRKGLDPRYANHYGLLVCVVILADVYHDMFLVADPQQTVYAMLVAIGAGSIILATGAVLGVLAAAMAGWLAVVLVRPGPDWTTFGFGLLATCVVAFVIHVVRIRTYRRLEVLRLVADKASIERDMREQALEAAVQSAWESEERYRRLVENAPDAFVVHSEGRIVYANPAALKLFGAAAPDELIGRRVLDMVHPDHREVVERRVRQIEDEQRPTELMEMRVQRRDGSYLDVEVMGQPISYMGKVADQTILRDITDRKRVEEQRRVAADQRAEIARLKEMDRMKTQFVNTLSHELRTPLTPIKVQLHLLKTANASHDEEKQKRATEMLERNVLRMGGLIDELLEVARLQAGNLKLDLAPLDLGAAVGEALDSFRDVAKAGGVELQTKVEKGLPVEADARRLTQVMYNLLNNALKFTPQGGRILVEAAREDGKARIHITDTGIGIAPDDIQRLFEPFSQVHDTMQKTNAGTGLGLYICKGILEGHGGRIWCTSPGPGKGTTFSFEMPLRA